MKQYKESEFVEVVDEETGAEHPPIPKAWLGTEFGEGLKQAGKSSSGSSGPSVDELKDEIDKRNEGREDDAKIVPAGTKKADLVAALKADDEKQAGS